MNNVTVNTLIQKYEASAGEIARAFGPFSLFGLFEREDNPGKLDLIVAAPWLKTDRGGLLKIASYLPHLTAEEGALIGRIVALERWRLVARPCGEQILAMDMSLHRKAKYFSWQSVRLLSGKDSERKRRDDHDLYNRTCAGY
jgi:hypothetical protein